MLMQEFWLAAQFLTSAASTGKLDEPTLEENIYVTLRR